MVDEKGPTITDKKKKENGQIPFEWRRGNDRFSWTGVLSILAFSDNVLDPFCSEKSKCFPQPCSESNSLLAIKSFLWNKNYF